MYLDNRTIALLILFTNEDLQIFIDNFDIPKITKNLEKRDDSDVQNTDQHLVHINFGVKSEDLFNYLINHPMMRELGCYHSYDIAKDSIKQTLLENKYKILDWINKDNRPKLRIKKRFFKDIGYKVYKNAKDAKP